ncbi:TPA: hypothetical protein ACNFPD_003367 [Enterobacter cancerogenus]
MKKLRLSFIPVIMLITSLPSYAITAITEVDSIEAGAPSGGRIVTTVTQWFKAPPGNTPSDAKVISVCTDKDGTGGRGCLHWGSMDEDAYMVKIDPGESWESARQKWISHYGSEIGIVKTDFAKDSGNASGGCFGLMYGTRGARGKPKGRVPGSICSNLPPDNVECSFSSPNVLIDFGTVSKQDIEGLTAEKYVGVTCTGEADLTLSVYSEDPSHLLGNSNGISTELEVNGTKIDNPDQLMSLHNAGDTTQISNKITLHGQASEGTYKGSYILFTNFS